MKDNELIDLIKPLVAEGKNVSDIHSFLKENHGVDKNFRELRMLVADCSVERKKAPKKEPKIVEPKKEEGKIFVESHVNPIQNYLMSGDVSFATGNKGHWYVDRDGALGLEISEDISTDDLHDLQGELEKIFK